LYTVNYYICVIVAVVALIRQDRI